MLRRRFRWRFYPTLSSYCRITYLLLPPPRPGEGNVFICLEEAEVAKRSPKPKQPCPRFAFVTTRPTYLPTYLYVHW